MDYQQLHFNFKLFQLYLDCSNNITKFAKIKISNMFKGIIYKYTSPSGKIYIGQTVDERKRRRRFLNLNEDYAGDKINNARKKYGPENFEYEVIERVECETRQDLIDGLNDLEVYYVEKYDTFRNGYNMSIGGEGSSGYKMTEEQRERHIHRMLTNNPFKGRKHTEETKKMIGKANGKPVLQIDKDTGEIIAEFESAKAAGEFFGKPRANSEIVKVCRGYVSPSGRHYITALGYKWKYKIEESSTTNENVDQKSDRNEEVLIENKEQDIV